MAIAVSSTAGFVAEVNAFWTQSQENASSWPLQMLLHCMVDGRVLSHIRNFEAAEKNVLLILGVHLHPVHPLPTPLYYYYYYYYY